MFDKAMKKSIESYLQPGEELLDAIGEPFQVEAPKASNPGKFVEAFERAKAGSAAPA